METVLPFNCLMGAANVVLSGLDSNYLHLHGTDTFLSSTAGHSQAPVYLRGE